MKRNPRGWLVTWFTPHPVCVDPPALLRRRSHVHIFGNKNRDRKISLFVCSQRWFYLLYETGPWQTKSFLSSATPRVLCKYVGLSERWNQSSPRKKDAHPHGVLILLLLVLPAMTESPHHQIFGKRPSETTMSSVNTHRTLCLPQIS